MKLQTIGESCVTLELDGAEATDPEAQRRVWALAATLRAEAAWREVVPGVGNLSVFFDPARVAPATALARLHRGWAAARPAAASGARVVRVPVRYGGDDGPDLSVLADTLGLTVASAVALHTQGDYTVDCLGFLPGFAYLSGLPPALHHPRRAVPRLRVPAGAVGIGGAQTGVYPVDSPGGWQWIGRTDLRLFDPERVPPALLQPGDRLVFEVEALHA